MEACKNILLRCINTKLFKRKPSFELLRLYSSFIITLRHVIYFALGSYQIHNDLYFLQSITTISNNSFICISAYFLANSDLKLSRYFPVIIWTFYYSMGIYLLAVITKSIKFDYETFYKFLFPVTHSVYWFSSAFIVSQILYALMVKGFKSIGFWTHFLVVIMWFVLACWGTIQYPNRVLVWQIGMNVNLFLYFYTIGNFIKIRKIRLNKYLSILGFVLTTIVHWRGILGDFNEILKDYPMILGLLNSNYMYCPLATFQTIFLILLAQEIPDIPYIGCVINFLAESSFGIYLCHLHPLVVKRDFESIDKSKYMTSSFWPCLNITGRFWLRSLVYDIINQFVLNFLVFNANWYSKFCNYVDTIFESSDDQHRAANADQTEPQVTVPEDERNLNNANDVLVNIEEEQEETALSHSVTTI